MTLRRREYLMERRFKKGATGDYDIRNFDDPWKVMSLEDHKEANRLFRRAMRAPAHSQIQNEFRKKLEALLRKYGIGEKKESKVVGEEKTRGLIGKRKKAILLVSNLLLARRNRNIKREQAEYEKLRVFCEKNGFDMSEVIEGATRELKKSIAARMGGIV